LTRNDHQNIHHPPPRPPLRYSLSSTFHTPLTSLSHSPLLLPQIPREIPLPHRRHRILRPRRLRNALPKGVRAHQPIILPLHPSSPKHHRAQRTHKRRLLRPRALRPLHDPQSPKLGCASNTKGEPRLRPPLRNRCAATQTARATPFNSNLGIQPAEDNRFDRISGSDNEFK
jgi:hypothetical protein